MIDANPPPRLWECSWLIIDLECITAVVRSRDASGDIIAVQGYREDEYEFTEGDGDLEDGQALVKAWKAYRAVRLMERP